MSVSDRLELKIIEAKDLLSVNGSPPSSYIEVAVGQDIRRTKQINESHDPVWNAPMIIFTQLVQNDIDSIHVYVKHKDVFSGKDTSIGVAIIHMPSFFNAPRVEIDDWYDITETSDMKFEAKGSIHIIGTYFNELDEDMNMENLALVNTTNNNNASNMSSYNKAPNLLQVLVVNGNDMEGGKSIEAYVVIQINNLRKETKVSRKSSTPMWDETIQIPVSDGTETIEILVYQSTLVRNIFIGKLNIPMVEVAATGEIGLNKKFPLLNEQLQFNDKINRGQVQLSLKWIYDQTVADELKKKKIQRASLFSRMTDFLSGNNKKKNKTKKKSSGDDDNDSDDENNNDDENDEEKGLLLTKSKRGGIDNNHDDDGDAEDNDNNARYNDNEDLEGMNPWEIDEYLKEQAKQRKQDITDILQVQQQLNEQVVEKDMPDGDYTVQVHIIEVSDIKGMDWSGLSDPFVVVELLGLKYKTSVQKQTLGAFYDETFYFNFKDKKKEEMIGAVLKLTLFDYNSFRPNQYIGQYSVDLHTVYNKPDHEMYRHVAALRDPTDKKSGGSAINSGSMGILKFSCVCLGPGDSQRVHDPTKDDDEDEQDFEVSEGIGRADGGNDMRSQTLQFLCVSVIRVVGLPGFDKMLGTSSGLYAFAQLDFAGCKRQKTTKVSVQGRNNLSISFDEELWVPVWVPTLCKKATLTIMHREFSLVRDKVVATAHIDFGQVQSYETDPISSTGVGSYLGFSKKQYQGPNFEWVHFYGANPTIKMGPKSAQLLNKFPSLGSAYRGSALISTRIVTHPIGSKAAFKRSMTYDIPETCLPKDAKYLFRLLAFQGSDIASSGKSNISNTGIASSSGSGSHMYCLGVTIGQNEFHTRYQSYANGCVDWLEILEGVDINLPSSLNMLPDIIITLYRGGASTLSTLSSSLSSSSSSSSSWQANATSMAYLRLKALPLLQNGLNNATAVWYDLKHDMSHKSTQTELYPGNLLLKIGLINIDDLGGIKSDWENDRKKILIKNAYCLRAYVYQCRKLPAVDDNGLIDPYIKIRFAGNKQKTEVKKRTQNPAYYSCLEFHTSLPTDLRLAPKIVVQVWDHKNFATKTPVAAFHLPLSQVTLATHGFADPPPPQWYEFYGIDGKGQLGEALIAFQLISKKSNIDPSSPGSLSNITNISNPKDITPAVKKVYLDIHIIGARNLVKSGYSGIRKPYIQFDLASNSYGVCIQTAPSRLPSPYDPNYLDRQIVMTMIPEDPMFVPPLEVIIYDQKLGFDSFIGSCAVDLRTKLPWNGADYIPPRQNKMIEETMKIRQNQLNEYQRQQLLLTNSGGNDKSKDGSTNNNNANKQLSILSALAPDEGLGVFPPEPGATPFEQGSKYTALPPIIDQEEKEILAYKQQLLANQSNNNNKKIKGTTSTTEPLKLTFANSKYTNMNNPLNLQVSADMVQLEEINGVGAAAKNELKEIKKLIGFPTSWANTDYLENREWWIKSKKTNAGGPLENYLETYPFENYEFYRGHVGFNKFNKRKDTIRKVGTLKAVIRVCLTNPRNDDEYAKFTKQVRKEVPCVIRLYAIRGQNLMPTDWNGLADPYLKISLGDKTLKDTTQQRKENLKTLNPEFHRLYEFDTQLPGPSLLKVEVMDRNFFSNDVTMGETIIDLEDRWFHPKWNALESKPLEARSLIKIGSQSAQGILLLWVDIMTAEDARKIPPILISGPEKRKFEIRIVCWRSLEVPALHGNSANLFAKFFMESSKGVKQIKHDTDTHWRCKKGEASWNWRIKIPIDVPLKTRELGRLRMQLFDRRIISSSEIVGETMFNLYDWLMLAYHRKSNPVFPFKEQKEALRKYKKLQLLNNPAAGMDEDGNNNKSEMMGITLEDDDADREEEEEMRQNKKEREKIDALLDEAVDGDDVEAMFDNVEDDIENNNSNTNNYTNNEDTTESAPLINSPSRNNNKNSPAVKSSSGNNNNNNTSNNKASKQKSKFFNRFRKNKKDNQDDDDDGGDDDEDETSKTALLEDDPEENETTKAINEISSFLGIGDKIAEDAEWFTLTFHDRKRNRLLKRGRLAISIQIVPEDVANDDKVGTGRNEPNQNPYLPPPFGRFSFSFNPLTLLMGICPGWVLCLLLCCCCCICIMAILSVASLQLSGLINIYDLIKGNI